MNVADRFSLLLLEPGEIYFNDHAVVYRLPHKSQIEKEGWENSWFSAEIKGRLKICSKSIVFDPRIKEIPLIKFPLKYCSLIQEGKSPVPEDPTIYYGEEDCTVEVTTDVTVEMLENNVIKPFKFRRKKYVHCFDLNFKKASDVLPQILQLQRASTLPPNDQNVMIQAIVRSLQKRKCFDYAHVKDSRENKVLELQASKVTPLVTNPGRILITIRAFYFQPFNNLEQYPVLRIPFDDIKQITKRRYLLRHVGIEIFYEERHLQRHLYIIFKEPEERDDAYKCLLQQDRLKLENCQQENIVYKWQAGAISNYEYLLHLNSQADRSVNDLTQYPVFPWLIADYVSDTLDLSLPDTFRDLSKPVGALNEDRLKRLKERCKEMPEPKFLYGSHYSTPGFVLFYLVRQHPLYMLCLQNGKFDHPDRMFNSVPDTWRNVTTNPSDFKELVPEFYDTTTCGEFLENGKAISFGTRQNGDPVWNVSLPPWAKSSLQMVSKMKEALECDYVSYNLHKWIDLIFGYKQKGKGAIMADNVFYPLCYEGAVDLGAITDINEKISLEVQIMEFGQIPKQIFQSPHPSKLRSLGLYNDSRLISLIQNNNENTSVEDEYSGMIGVQGNLVDIRIPKLIELYYQLDLIAKLREVRLHRKAVTYLMFTPDGKTIISLAMDGLLKAYSFPFLEKIGNFDSGSLTFSTCLHIPLTTEVLIGSWDNYLYRFNYKLCQKKEGLQAHSDAITCMDMNKDVLLTGSWDCLVRVWDVANISHLLGDSGWSGWRLHMNDLICQMDHDGPVNCVVLHPFDELFASATVDGFVCIWRLRSDSNISNIQCHNGAINDLVWSPDGERVLSCGDDGRIVLLDSQSGIKVSVINLKEALKCLIWDGRILITGNVSGSLVVYDVIKEEILRTFNAHTGPVTAISLSPDRQHFITGGEDGRVVLWGLKSDK